MQNTICKYSFKNMDLVTYGILNSLLIYFYLGGYALYLFMIINLIKKLINEMSTVKKDLLLIYWDT